MFIDVYIQDIQRIITFFYVFIVVCKFVAFSILKLGWNTEEEHSKQLARIAKLLCVNFLCWGKTGTGHHRR